jgi:aspartate racemase
MVYKRIGIVGGMGPLATAAFHRLLVLNTDAHSDQAHVPVVVDSDPRVPDRTAFLLGLGEDPRPALRASARRLASAGAELLVMPCNTANAFADDVAMAAGLPLVPWLETAVDAVAACLPAARGRCGILGTTGTLRAGLYARILATKGIEAITPDEHAQADVMAAIYAEDGVKASGSVSPARREGLLRAAMSLADRGCDVLLLACTELPLAVPADDTCWPRPTVDPAVEVARRTILLSGATVTPGRASA